MIIDLSTFDNSWYNPGGTSLKRFFWYFTNILFFKNAWNPCNGIKIKLLKLFGAQLGSNITIKPSVNIKYPWKLSIGNNHTRALCLIRDVAFEIGVKKSSDSWVGTFFLYKVQGDYRSKTS